jgi:DNA polymerase
MNQVKHLHENFDTLQLKYGDSQLQSIYGAGNINKPELMFIFMNPTGRNVASSTSWKGLRAPWIGTKQIWSMFTELGLVTTEIFNTISTMKNTDWDYNFSESVYKNLQENSVYVTNLAKCTQIDARPLNNNVFREYLNLMYEEIQCVNPKRIITFGNQVSSILLGKNVSVSKYLSTEYEELIIENKKYLAYPTFYPVGQGRRNQPYAVSRIKSIEKI